MYPDPNQQQPPTQPPQQMPPQGAQPPYPQPITPPTGIPPVHDYIHPIVDPPKRGYHPKRFMIALGVFVGICIIGVGIMLAIALMPQATPKPKTDTTKDTSKTSTSLTAATAIAHVKEYFKGTAAAKSPIMLPVEAPNTNYYTVVSDTAPLVSVAGSVAPDKGTAQIASIVHSLDSDGFTKTIISDGSGTTNYQAYFVRSDVICEADLVKPQDTKADQWIEAKCLDMSTYSTYANDESGFANLYTPLSATSVVYGFVGKPTVTNGSVAGYKRGQIQVSSVISNQMTSDGKYAVYYQTPDGLWHYFADQDNTVAIECESYTTKDEQSAFAGVPCRSLKTGAMSTVPAPKKGNY